VINMDARGLQRALRARINSKKKAKILAGFFKTGPGEYGEGDIFIGVMVPQTRAVVREFAELPLGEIKKLLRSKVHEDRLAALLLLVDRFGRTDARGRSQIYDLYLQQMRHINNWDLVDVSADKIVGAHLYSHILQNKGISGVMSVLVRLARSPSLWERRIAMLATFWFIKKGNCAEAFEVADLLLGDRHDLIHKAVGWMLREAGSRCSVAKLEKYLKTRYKKMPRTMLRYAIEKFSPARRARYLAGAI
jgi:3-methyladenine DNA glycosylase AlkD